MLLGITTEGKIGLAIVAGLFIAFAILSSFWFPRRNPGFPGNRLGLFVLVTIALFVATVAAVVVFAKEEEEVGHAAETTETQMETGGETTETQTTETDGGETTAPTETTAAGGDAAAGEAVFASAGCGACHTLEAAGSTGTVGPNLDESRPDAALAEERVRNGAGAMPAFEGQLTDEEIADVVAYVVESTRS